MEQGEGGREQKLWRAGEERPLGKLELDRVGEDVVAKFGSDPKTPEIAIISENHNVELVGKRLPLVVVILRQVLWVRQLDGARTHVVR